MSKLINLSEVVLRKSLSTRGGGIEIDLTRFGFKNENMSAYQNYLGGGILGKVCANNTLQAFDKPLTDKQVKKLGKISERLKLYFHELTNPEEEEWESQSYEENQSLPSSAY